MAMVDNHKADDTLVEDVLGKDGGQKDGPEATVRVQLLAHVHYCLVVVQITAIVPSDIGHQPRSTHFAFSLVQLLKH